MNTESTSRRPAFDGPFANIRILDLSQVRAGPTCVKQFADFGADVIQIETPAAMAREILMTGARDGGDMLNLHRNKRSMTLNLKSTQGQEVFQRLVRTADVIVENFKPSVKQRLGLEYDTLSALNPRIILASISGYGQTGPLADQPGFDQIAQGMTGLMEVTGEPDGQPHARPLRTGAAVDDMAAGLYAALGIMTALHERQQSGRGQWVQTSLLEAGAALMDFRLAYALIDQREIGRKGNDHPTSMPTSAYPTQDGYLNIGASGQAMWTRLCSAMAAPELSDAKQRPDYATDALRSANREKLNRELSDIFQTHPTAYWLANLRQAGVPCGPVLKPEQVFSNDQVQHLKIAAQVHHPSRGDVQVIRQGARLSRTPDQIVFSLPELGAHTEQVLADLGYSAQEIASLVEQQII
jgi:crotonobetainyl-CoA:carnitine CoA-transferase CaiB-like acyl-CoA transferase